MTRAEWDAKLATVYRAQYPRHTEFITDEQITRSCAKPGAEPARVAVDATIVCGPRLVQVTIDGQNARLQPSTAREMAKALTNAAHFLEQEGWS
jgi:hypothetical protein